MIPNDDVIPYSLSWNKNFMENVIPNDVFLCRLCDVQNESYVASFQFSVIERLMGWWMLEFHVPSPSFPVI